MTLLTGLTEDGNEVPVQVKPDGRLVAEGLQGAPGKDAPVIWDRTGTVLIPTNDGDSVLIGGTLPTAPNISLNADGSAEFAGQVRAFNLPVTANGVFNATDNVFEVSTLNPSLSSQFGKFQGRINPSVVADSTISVRFLMDSSLSANPGVGNACILKLYDSLFHNNTGRFDIKEQHYHFAYKWTATSAVTFPVTPAYSDSATGQPNESATMTLSNPTFRGFNEGAPYYVQFDLSLGSGRTNPRHIVCYELLVLTISDLP